MPANLKAGPNAGRMQSRSQRWIGERTRLARGFAPSRHKFFRKAIQKDVSARARLQRARSDGQAFKPAREGARAPQKTKKSLAMPMGIVTRGVILRALGEYMRKFKRFPPRTLRFRSLLILAGAFALLAAFTPWANAALIRYYNMEGVEPTPPYPVNLDSHPPAIEIGGLGRTLDLDNGNPGVPYPSTRTSAETGLPGNIAPGDPART